MELETRNPNLSVTVAMSKPGNEPWFGAVGRIDAALLASAVPDIVSGRAHICGPPSMMEAVQAALIGLGVPETQIKTEAFGTVKRDPTAKGAASTEVAGKVVFQASDTTAPVPVVRRSLMRPTKRVFSSTTPAAQEHADRVASSSYRAV